MGDSSTTAIDFDNLSTKPISPTSLAHVVLRTNPNNLIAMRDFYLTFLGARVQHESGPLCFMTYDSEHHRIALIGIERTSPKQQTTCGLEHIAFTYPSLIELFLSYRQKLRAGIKPVWCVNHGPTMSMYYRDPDGNTLESQVDLFETAEQANEYMFGKEFQENPIGVDYDPEEMIRRITAGEPEDQLRKRPDIGPRGVPKFME